MKKLKAMVSKVRMDFPTIEEQCMDILSKRDLLHKADDYYSYEDALTTELEKDYIVLDDVLYRVIVMEHYAIKEDFKIINQCNSAYVIESVYDENKTYISEAIKNSINKK